jgi:RHS repeat-associated protein
MDIMGYTYNGNQLLGVKDSGDKTAGFIDGSNLGNDYSYDANGNMVNDQNKNLTADNAIQYNHLNLPVQVIKNTGEKIVYTYDAGGRKLTQQVFNATGNSVKTTDYDGEFIYQGDTLQFVNHEEGRIVMKNSPAPEYQYHLKDHLGNVRLTFTSHTVVEPNLATYEPANANVEQSKFLRYANARRVNSTLFDHTNNGTTAYSERLSASANEKYGLARSISVMPGDVIQTEVYAKYVDPSSSNWTAALSSLMGQIATSAAGVVYDGTYYSTSTSSFPASFGSLLSKTDDGAPKAYLNWLVFDRNFVLQPNSGFKQITTVCKENGSNVPHEYLTSPNITITQPGYVYIYLSNEAQSQVEVYFDDFSVTHTRSPIVEATDYYAFGSISQNSVRENSVKDDIKFNGKELQDELDLDLYDYVKRFYDPNTGRFISVDPLANRFPWWTPYQFAGLMPTKHVDLDGMEPASLDIQTGKVYPASDHFRYTPPEGTVPLHDGPESQSDPIIETAVGFTPAGVILDVADLATAIHEGSAVDVTIAAVAFVPGLDFLKGGKKIFGAIADGANKVKKYDVGNFDDLVKRSDVGDHLDIHHVSQKQPAGQVIAGYNKKTAPAIALPANEHKLIPTMKGTRTAGNARQQLAKDIKDLRQYTNSPIQSLQKLIELHKKKYPEAFKRKKVN